MGAQEQQDQGQGQQKDIEEQVGEQQVVEDDNPAVVSRPPPSPQGDRKGQKKEK